MSIKTASRYDSSTISISGTKIEPHDIIDALQKAPNGWYLTGTQMVGQTLRLTFSAPPEELYG